MVLLQVNEAMVRIDRFTQQIALPVVQTKDAAACLQRRSALLTELVGVYGLHEMAPARQLAPVPGVT